jgi:YVTN family beta-propeller protein
VVDGVQLGSASDVAVSAAGSRAYVTNAGWAELVTIDTATNTVIGEVKVGDFPRAVAVTPPAPKAVADLSVKTSCEVKVVMPGSTFLCTNMAYSAGPDTASNVVVAYDTPEELTATGSCGVNPVDPEFVCTKATYEPGLHFGTGHFLTAPDDLGPGVALTTTATVSSATFDPEPANNSMTLTLSTPACTIDRRGAKSAQAIDGTPGDDVICGSPYGDDISGLGGNDVVFGGGGGDTIKGGDGKDFLYGGDGGDELLGGNGDDVLYGNSGSDHLAGGTGTDSASGGANADSCFAEAKVSCEE